MQERRKIISQLVEAQLEKEVSLLFEDKKERE